jgi:hypothetical protein
VPERAAPKAPSKEEKAQAKPKQEDADLQTKFNNFIQPQQANPERNIFAEMMARNEAQRAENKKSMAEDRNLALLAAGLGMLGGTSPYAAVNIGQGGAKGVEFLGASKARRASELNALSNADLKAMYYGEENKRKERALGLGMAERSIDNLAAYDAKLRKNYFIEGITPTAKQLEAYENAKRNDPIYRRLSQDANLVTSAPAKSRTLDFSKI